MLALPTSGSAWSNVLTWAAKSASPDVSNQDDNSNVIVLAKALVYARTGDATRRSQVVSALGSVQGTESGSRALAIGRELGAYILAADLIGYHDAGFVSWVAKMRTFATSGGPSSLTACSNQRPNNWGTWCRASLVIANLYLDDSIAHDIALFRGYLGERAQYSSYSYGDLSWQCDTSAPVGINRAGCSKSGHDIGGVIPDDQRRGGSFSWPPPCENYTAESLQGTTLEAQVLAVAGQPVMGWSDSAIKRAAQWREAQGCHFTGDDAGTNSFMNHYFGLGLPASGAPGKGWGYQDWLLP